MPISPRWGIDHPLGTEQPNIDVDLANIVNALEALGAQYGQGTLAARPVSSPGTPGKAGRFYVVTSGAETGQLHYDYGTGWLHLNPDQTPADNSITSAKIADGTIANVDLADGAVGATAKIADGIITAAKLANALKPSTGAGAATEAPRALGTAAGNAAAGTHGSQHHPSTGADKFAMSLSGTFAARPAANTVADGTFYYATDNGILYQEQADAWVKVATKDYADLDGIPTSFAPSAHASSHANGGSDPLPANAIVRSMIADAAKPRFIIWRRVATSTVGHNVEAVAVFDTEDQDDWNGGNLGTGVLAVAGAGVVRVTANFEFVGATGGGSTFARIAHYNSGAVFQRNVAMTDGGMNWDLSLTATVKVAAGDYFTIHTLHGATGSGHTWVGNASLEQLYVG